jgi:dihydrolipoamide dehydrogenase
MSYDIIIIGSGPGGYVAAIRASQLGMKVGVIEKAEPGGICLNWGCIPTKALMKSAQVYNYLKHSADYGINISGDINADFNSVIQRSRKVAENMSKGIEFLFKKNKISLIAGFGKIKSPNTVEVYLEDGNIEEFKAKHIIIATGARSKEIQGVKQDGKKIISYREALTLDKLPETMAIIGSGAIGTEFAYFYQSMGTQVTLIEYFDSIVPLEDKEVSKQLERSFKKMKMKVLTGAAVEKGEIKGNSCELFYTDKKGSSSIEADVVLSAVGVVPNLENIGLEENGIEMINGKIKVDEFYRTNVEGVYAIGDIVPGHALAHVASAEGICCVEKIAGLNPPNIDYENIPTCVYAVPEIASVGITQEMAEKQNLNIKIGKFPFMASGKAAAAGNRDGFVKIIFDADTDLLLGAHFIGDNVTEMISEMVVTKKLNGTGMDLIKSIHPHPSLSEAIMEAAAAAHDEAIHL